MPSSAFGFGGENSSETPKGSPSSVFALEAKSLGRGGSDVLGPSLGFSFPNAARNRFGNVFLVRLKLKETFCLPCSSRFTFVRVPLGKKRLDATPLKTAGPLTKPGFWTFSLLPCKARWDQVKSYLVSEERNGFKKKKDSGPNRWTAGQVS